MQKKSKVLIAIVVVAVLVLATIVFTSCIPVSQLTPTPTKEDKPQQYREIVSYVVPMPEDIANDGTGTPKIISFQKDGGELFLTYAYIDGQGKGVKTAVYYFTLENGWVMSTVYVFE